MSRRLPFVLWKRRFCQKPAFPREEFRPVIGLEVHVQLKTRSKLFSCTPCSEDGAPNTLVTAFDMATPGTLPVLNKACVMHALRMGLLLNCEIPRKCRFDRKHYFYADMPAGYQITQSEFPIAKNGQFRFAVYGESIPTYFREVRIIQLQLEQDSGKSIHFGPVSLVDLNRAGMPLVEVVSSPDFRTALEAVCFVQQLRLLLMHNGICGGEMHRGQLRVDANVSLSHLGNKGIRTEIKNINSLRHLHTAINFEIDRHYKVISGGGKVMNETRMCDDHGRTVSMRDKEVKTDYRFMPEPNLPTLKILQEWIEDCANSISTTPNYVRYQTLGFDPRRAVYYAENPSLSHFLNMCVDRLPNVGAENFINWMNELKLIMQRTSASYPPDRLSFAQQFMTVVEFYVNGKVTKLCALEALRQFVGKEQDAEEYFNRKNAWRITDEGKILSMADVVMKKNGNLVGKAMGGHAKSMAKLRKLLVDESEKRIEVKDADEAITSKIEKLKDKG